MATKKKTAKPRKPYDWQAALKREGWTPGHAGATSPSGRVVLRAFAPDYAEVFADDHFCFSGIWEAAVSAAFSAESKLKVGAFRITVECQVQSPLSELPSEANELSVNVFAGSAEKAVEQVQYALQQLADYAFKPRDFIP